MKGFCNRRTRLLLSTVLIGILMIAAFAAGRWIPDDAVASNFAQAKAPPSWTHPFGTDWLGRDLFLRTLKGLSTSLTVGCRLGHQRRGSRAHRHCRSHRLQGGRQRRQLAH